MSLINAKQELLSLIKGAGSDLLCFEVTWERYYGGDDVVSILKNKPQL